MSDLYIQRKEEFEKKSININHYVEQKVREIVAQVDEIVIHNVPTETLFKIKSKIEEELKNREEVE